MVANKIQMNFSLSDKQIRTLDNRETQAHVIHVPNFHFILLNKYTSTCTKHTNWINEIMF